MSFEKFLSRLSLDKMDKKEHCSVGEEHTSLILFNTRGEKYKILTFFAWIWTNQLIVFEH